MTRRLTRQIRVGDVNIGGNAPVSIQSMAKVETSDVKSVISQVNNLEKYGCQIIRVAVKTLSDARAIKDIKKKIRIPLVADIHFDYRLALESIKNNADKIRLNPGNIKKRDEIVQVVRAAKKTHIPVRIGVNSGSVSRVQRSRGSLSRQSRPLGRERQKNMLIYPALQYIKLFEDLNFHDIIISLKGSDVSETVEAYRAISTRCDYPLHLGVTASGPYDYGIVKSSIGIGALLLDGIGDTIRVSLTAEPEEEISAAKRILSSLGLRKFGPEIISCPTCGRCQVDLFKIAGKLERELSAFSFQSSAKNNITIAVMGCEVNGPGEAREADIGIAFGKGSGMLFKKGKIVKKVTAENAVKELLAVIARAQ